MSNSPESPSTSPAAPRKKKRKKKSLAAAPAPAGNGASGRPKGVRRPPSKAKLACAGVLSDAAKSLRRGIAPEGKVLGRLQRCIIPKE